MKRSTTFLATSSAAVLVLTGLSSPSAFADNPPKPASPPIVQSCPPEPVIYSITNVQSSMRPTNLYSAYVTGPATVGYSESSTATASAAMSASVSAEAGLIITKASATIGVTLTASYSSTGGFSYSLPVPSGQRRRMRLWQVSKYFVATKKTYSTGLCKYLTSYSDGTNAPKKVREDEWKLEA